MFFFCIYSLFPFLPWFLRSYLFLIQFRQFKEQLRQQRHSEQIVSAAASSSYQRAQHHLLLHHHQEQELQQQPQEYGTEFEQPLSIAAVTPSDSTSNTTKTTSASPSSDTRVQQHQQVGITSKSSLVQHFDVKTMQKEAVLSYVKVQLGRFSDFHYINFRCVSGVKFVSANFTESTSRRCNDLIKWQPIQTRVEWRWRRRRRCQCQQESCHSHSRGLVQLQRNSIGRVNEQYPDTVHVWSRAVDVVRCSERCREVGVCRDTP